MLSRHRIDLITGTDLIAAHTMKQLGRQFDELERLIQVDDRYEYYLALNLKTPGEIINLLQKALDRAKADGEYDRIRQAYF